MDMITQISEVEQKHEVQQGEIEKQQKQIEDIKKLVRRLESRQRQQLFERDLLAANIDENRQKIQDAITKACATKQMKIDLHQDIIKDLTQEAETKLNTLETLQAHNLELCKQFEVQETRKTEPKKGYEDDKILDEIDKYTAHKNTVQDSLDSERQKTKDFTEKLEALTKSVQDTQEKVDETNSTLEESNALFDDLTMTVMSLKSEQMSLGGGKDQAEAKASLFDEVNVNRENMYAQCVQMNETYEHMKNVREGLEADVRRLKRENYDLRQIGQYQTEVGTNMAKIELAYTQLRSQFGINLVELNQLAQLRSAVESKVVDPFEVHPYCTRLEKYTDSKRTLPEDLGDIQCGIGHVKYKIEEANQEVNRLSKDIEKYQNKIDELENTMKMVEPLEFSESLVCICKLKKCEEKKPI